MFSLRFPALLLSSYKGLDNAKDVLASREKRIDPMASLLALGKECCYQVHSEINK